MAKPKVKAPNITIQVELPKKGKLKKLKGNFVTIYKMKSGEVVLSPQKAIITGRTDKNGQSKHLLSNTTEYSAFVISWNGLLGGHAKPFTVAKGTVLVPLSSE